jgi:hypothetical protein
MWHGEAFYGLGVQGVEVLILLGALFPLSVAPASQQGLRVTELTLVLHPSRHLGASLCENSPPVSVFTLEKHSL